MLPCTPAGIINILEFYNVNLRGTDLFLFQE